MKTIAQLKEVTPVYLNDWDSREAVFKDFDDTRYEDDVVVKEKLSKHDGENIILASYSYENYSGYALFYSKKMVGYMK